MKEKIVKSGVISIIGAILAAMCFSLLFYKIIGLYLSRGKSYEYKKKKIGKMEELMAYEDKLKGIGDSFIKLSKKSVKWTNTDFNDDEIDESQNIMEMLLNNQISESRKLLSMYLYETGKLIKNISRSTLKTFVADAEKKELLVNKLGEKNIICRDINILQERGRKKVVIKMKCKAMGKKTCNIKNVAAIISQIIGKQFVVESCDNKALDNKFAIYTFKEDVNYYIMHGMAKKSKEKAACGDNFTCMNLENGQTLLSITDGMGTGTGANRESGMVLELIEEFMGCGFSDELTLKLVNSLFLPGGFNVHPTTVDMSIIDMHSGVCDILKLGAATTYVKRDGWVEAIKSTSLPVVALESLDMETTKKKLYDGDFLIMVSDGVSDSIDNEEKDQVISQIILDSKSKKPKELAAEILNRVSSMTNNAISDDMTVLVTGIWDKIA